MRASKLAMIVMLVATVVTTGVQAEGSYSNAPHYVLLGVRQIAECGPQLQRLQAESPELGFRSDWTVVIACTSLAWEGARTKAGRPPTKTAFTSLQAKITVLNGAIFYDLRGEYRHTLAHELGHIECNCSDEGRAEQAGLTLLRRKVPPRLGTSARGFSSPRWRSDYSLW
jgi:hypothetical protein